MILILGAGLAGLSAFYHLGHENCLLLEKHLLPFGHLHSEIREGFTWDQGPHVSFTKSDYVRELFAKSVCNKFEEYEVKTANYYQGNWIDHPAQSSLYQIPEPLRSSCLKSFLATRQTVDAAPPKIENYQVWLDHALGPVFARTFPAAYTRKYRTREPSDLTTAWVGGRVFYPNVEDVFAGAKGPLPHQTLYITQVRYLSKGGYQSFVKLLAENANIHYGAEVIRIDLVEKKVWCTNASACDYDRLINTLPLPVFVNLCAQATPAAKAAASRLSCSQLLLVNVTAPHPTLRTENWIYVYDEDKYSTRINCTEKLSTHNAPKGQTGVQVEVYFNRHRPLAEAPGAIAEKVISELGEMGLIDKEAIQQKTVWNYIVNAPWANVVFDHDTAPALDQIWTCLEPYGLEREADDLHPLTDWKAKPAATLGPLCMAGRFGQWKYFWTDDCVLRGQTIGALG